MFHGIDPVEVELDAWTARMRGFGLREVRTVIDGLHEAEMGQRKRRLIGFDPVEVSR